MRLVSVPLVAIAATLSWACGERHAGAGAREAEKAVLERELEGLRASVERLDRGDPIFPASDVLVAIDETFVQGLITARLPFDVTSAPYTVTLTGVDVRFRGAPTVALRGTIAREGVVALEATVGLQGALTRIEIDRKASMLRAAITADHFEIERAAGIESFLSGASLDDIASLLRQSVADQMPLVEIPVRIQQDLDIPAVTSGPVRLDALRLPLNVMVSRVVAGERRLWISLNVEVGKLTTVKP